MAAEQRARRPLRVLVVGLNFEPEAAGIAPYTSGVVRGLAERGHDVHVLTSYPHYPQWRVHAGFDGHTHRDVAGSASVTRLRHYVPRRPATLNRLLMEVLFGLRAVTARWRGPDVVLVVSPALVASSMALVRARLHRVPVVTWVQDIYTLGVVQTGGSRRSSAIRAVESWLLRRSTRVVVIHERFRAFVRGELGVDVDVDVVRNWSHVEAAPAFDRAAVRRRHGWADDEVIVLHAGNMGAKQGLDNVVHASRVAAEHGSRVRFILMGDGLRRSDLEALDPNPRLQFLDPLPDGHFEQALEAADVLLVNELPGLTEMSVPSKLTTYWATGRPVVAAVDPGSTTAEEITVSGAGLLVPPAAPRELVEAVTALVADPGRCAALTRAGEQFRRRHLSVAAGLDAFETVLARAVGDDPPTHSAASVLPPMPTAVVVGPGAAEDA